uniref:Uncharacterized protein n=1 Tax=Siphoviridae sp. ctWT735 TaxID=2825538 RepID=A0A8S5TUD3_9CAUD|nr:MAG TPA: hypothetical protein [Siphoviridae sp. ctWT735]
MIGLKVLVILSYSAILKLFRIILVTPSCARDE